MPLILDFCFIIIIFLILTSLCYFFVMSNVHTIVIVEIRSLQDPEEIAYTTTRTTKRKLFPHLSYLDCW